MDVLVRPEAVAVQPDPAGSARVLTASFLGATTRVFVTLPDGTGLKADLATREAVDLLPGTPVLVRLAEQSVMVVPR